ncbi:MAG: hypothetical protein ABL883_09715 [Terricaulis sp.]
MRASVGAALRFVREEWRLVLLVAGIGAVAQALALAALGATLSWPVAFLLIAIAGHAALTRATLSGSARVQLNLAGDTLRTLGCVAIVGLFAAIVFIVVLYLAMSALIAPYMEQAKAAGENEAALRAVLETAIAAQPDLLRWIGLAGAVIIFALTSRFFFAAPLSIERGKVLAFQSWAATRGYLLKIMLARFVLLAPALTLAGALQSIAGVGAGVPVGDPILIIQRAFSNPLFWGALQFLQIAVYGALEASLSAHLYRRLAPAPQAGK